MADISVENHGTIFLFFPQTEAGTAWIKEYVDDGYEFTQGALVVEHRHAWDIAQGAIADGLEIV